MSYPHPMDDKTGFADDTAGFDEWMVALDAAHAKRGFPYGDGPLAKTTGQECWMGYFRDGYSPEDAIEEDQSYD